MTSTGARVNHAQVEAYARRYAKFNMRNTVRITRPIAPVFDPATSVCSVMIRWNFKSAVVSLKRSASAWN